MAKKPTEKPVAKSAEPKKAVKVKKTTTKKTTAKKTTTKKTIDKKVSSEVTEIDSAPLVKETVAVVEETSLVSEINRDIAVTEEDKVLKVCKKMLRKNCISAI